MDREVSLILKNLGYLLQNRLYLCFFEFIRYTWSVVILNSTYKSFIDLTSSSLCERSATEKSKSSIEPLGIFLLGKRGFYFLRFTLLARFGEVRFSCATTSRRSYFFTRMHPTNFHFMHMFVCTPISKSRQVCFLGVLPLR